jgi:hypothetical protein
MAGEPNTYSDGDVDEIIADLSKRIAELEGKIQQCFSIVWGADSIDEARQRVAALLGKFEAPPRPLNPIEPDSTRSEP